MKTNQANKQLIYPELSYKIMGVLFKVHNLLGPSYQERYYQRAIEKELKDQKIPYQKQVPVEINYGNSKIGQHILDFVIDNKIILEIKVLSGEDFSSTHQILSYLKSSNLKLGIVANFRTPKLIYKRVINPGREIEH